MRSDGGQARDRSCVGGEAVDLPEEGVAVEVEEAGEGGLLVGHQGRVDAVVGHPVDGRPPTASPRWGCSR